LSVNIFVEVICGVNYQYHASSTAADHIPIVGAAKSLVQRKKDLTIPKFGVLSYSSIYKRRETVSSGYTYNTHIFVPLSIYFCASVCNCL
jgi:hypothetical protein